MNIKGGTLLFETDVKSVQAIILEILNDTATISEFIHKNTSGEGVIYIFKIKFNNEKFNKYFKNSDSTTPSVFIIKLFAHNYTKTTINLGMPGKKNTPTKQYFGINESQFQNEIETHKSLGSQTNSKPLCPSFLHHERINTGPGEASFTDIGTAFYNVIKKDRAQFNDFEKFILFTLSIQDKTIPLPTIPLPRGFDALPLKEYSLYDVIQEIIIMEYVDCKTLFQIYNTTHNTDEEKQFKYGKKFLYGTNLNLPKIHIEQTFYLLYLATLLALEGYSHGDLHTNNVLLCSKLRVQAHESFNAEIDVEPILIDFGKAEKLTNLKFRVILGTDDAPITRANKYWNKNEQLVNFIDIYYEAERNQANIKQFIDDKLKSGEFVYAIIVISMCISKNASVKERSMFMHYLIDRTLYETFYSMFEKVIIRDTKGDYIQISINYDEKIKEFIQLRNSLLQKKMAPTVLELELSGGKYNKHKYQKRTQRKRRRTLYKKNSKKTKNSKNSKKKKSKKIKTRSIK